MGLPIKNTKLNTIEGIDTFYNGGKGSGNFGHAGRPGKVGGSGDGQGSSRKIRVHEGSKETDYYYAEDGNRILASGKTREGVLAKVKEKLSEKKKDYGEESHSVAMRDGSAIRSEYVDLADQLETARTNLKTLKENTDKAYDDLAGRDRYMTRSASISSALHFAQAMSKSKMSAETKALVKEMESELKKINDEYSELGAKKYFDPDLNHEK